MVEVQILIPLADNAGNVFLPDHHDDFAAYLTGLFGGCSAFSGVVSGQWADAGTVYHDETRVYAVAVAGLLARAADLTAAAAFAKAHYGQHAVYVRYLGQSEIL